jgi:hypothetical protein
MIVAAGRCVVCMRINTFVVLNLEVSRKYTIHKWGDEIQNCLRDGDHIFIIVHVNRYIPANIYTA